MGGLLMLLIGILYITFEKSAVIPASSSSDGLAAPKADSLSRTLTGVQVS